MREEEIISKVRRGELQFPPAQFRLLSTPKQLERAFGDGIIEIKWGTNAATFLIDVKSATTPRAIDEAAKNLKVASSALGLNPLLICPYLSEDGLLSLQMQGVSGLDLNGNGVIATSEMSIWRSGNPNRIKGMGPRRNPYGGDSSIFARCLLLQNEFDSLIELREYAVSKVEIEGGFTGLTLPTASRVIDALAEELVVIKQSRTIRLVDKTRLMNGLKKSFRPTQGNRILGKTELPANEVWARLDHESKAKGLASVATGIASAGWYRALSGVNVLSIYVTDLERATDIVPIKPGKAFANIEFIEERRPLVYFDAQKTSEGIWSSPIQCWLELATGGPREQEAAQALMTMLRQGSEGGGS